MFACLLLLQVEPPTLQAARYERDRADFDGGAQARAQSYTPFSFLFAVGNLFFLIFFQSVYLFTLPRLARSQAKI